LVHGTTLVLKKIFLKVEPNAAPKFFKNFLGPKIKYLDRYKYPKKAFSEFFSLISWGVCNSTKREKVVFSDLVPVLKVNLEYLTQFNY
jgi:hypothetical protein